MEKLHIGLVRDNMWGLNLKRTRNPSINWDINPSASLLHMAKHVWQEMYMTSKKLRLLFASNYLYVG